MKKKKKYLELYKKWLESGKLPTGLGLCNEFGTYASGEPEKDGIGYWNDELFATMCPPKYGNSYWGGPVGEFTPLRQTIVLFMAAMNDEL